MQGKEGKPYSRRATALSTILIWPLLSKTNLLGQHLRVGRSCYLSITRAKGRICHRFLHPRSNPQGPLVLDSIFRRQGAYSGYRGKSCPKRLFQTGSTGESRLSWTAVILGIQRPHHSRKEIQAPRRVQLGRKPCSGVRNRCSDATENRVQVGPKSVFR